MATPHLCLVFSSNILHADLSRRGMQRLYGEGELQRILAAINTIPCSLSIEGFDAEICPELGEFAKNSGGLCEVISGEYAHGFLDWYESANPFLALDNLMLGLNSHPVRFLSEYTTVPHQTARQFVQMNKAMKRSAKPAFYALDSQTNLYSDAHEVGAEIKLLEEFKDMDGVHAIESDGMIYLRMYMKYFTEMSKPFFGFQRFRSHSDEVQRVGPEKIIEAFTQQLEVADKDNVPVVFFPMDIESCVIGSHHGATIYEEFASALRSSGIEMIGPRAAYDLLAPMAIHSQRPHRLMNDKWEGYEMQRRLQRRIVIAQTKPFGGKNLTPSEKKVTLLAGNSDGTVVQKFRIRKQASLASDGENLLIGGANMDSYEIQMAALEAIEGKGSFAEKIQKLANENPNSQLINLVRSWASSLT